MNVQVYKHTHKYLLVYTDPVHRLAPIAWRTPHSYSFRPHPARSSSDRHLHSRVEQITPLTTTQQRKRCHIYIHSGTHPTLHNLPSSPYWSVMKGTRLARKEMNTSSPAALLRNRLVRCRALARAMRRYMCTDMSRLMNTLVTGKNCIHLNE